MAAVASEKIVEPSLPPSPPLSMSRTPSRRVSDAAASDSSATGTPDRPNSLDHSPSSSRQLDYQNQLFLRSEEYRQLFRLPQDEVLIQDFNCALQENFLLQGHMYLFAHYICFYSNLFGFETKKIIPLIEVTSVRRAKAAAIFPTAIEIIAGAKKFFFTSFLSRDEAFKLINDGWSQNNGDIKPIADEQESITGSNSLENGGAIVEKVETSGQLVDESNLIERDKDGLKPEGVESQANGELEASALNVQQENGENNVEIVQNTDCSSSAKSLAWEPVDYDAPEVPEGYTMVVESKFPVTVEEFFQFFFSDQAVDFQDSFHRKCGDRDFKQSEWRPHEKSGYTRHASFQHPIKLYLGAKFGACKLVQKYQVYKNCHFVVETSQEVSDVPFADYFRVEGLWHVERDTDESTRSCVLSVYVNVNFLKKTMWKGKIVQSTIEECREVYGIWMNLAHQLLKQKNLEVKEGNLIQSNQAQRKTEDRTPRVLLKPDEVTERNSSQVVNHNPVDLPNRNHRGSSSVGSFSDLLVKFCSAVKQQNRVSLLLIIGIAVILLLMQASILALLSRPQQIHVVPQADWMYSLNRGGTEISGGEIALLDTQIKHLKEELHMVETLLDKMQQEHALLKLRLSDLERNRKRQK